MPSQQQSEQSKKEQYAVAYEEMMKNQELMVESLTETKKPALQELISEADLKIIKEKRERENKEKRLREFRFQNRKSIDELLLRILNGDLFDMFAG